MKNKMVPWRARSERKDSKWEEHPFDPLQHEVNDLFETYYRGAGPFGRSAAGGAGFELSETDDEIRVRAELPGMDEKDIQVTLEEDALTIRGERSEEKETKKRSYHVSEMSHGVYHRVIPLPSRVASEKAEAKFKRGVLTLKLPKTGPAKAARARVEVVAD